jgi:hypothetical protein
MTHSERLASDPTYADAFVTYMRLGDEVDAANDGAIHHTYPADIADRMVAAINHQYARARRVFFAM